LQERRSILPQAEIDNAIDAQNYCLTIDHELLDPVLQGPFRDLRPDFPWIRRPHEIRH
jgi:hypothetical protein